jgi:hypothetical protein
MPIYNSKINIYVLMMWKKDRYLEKIRKNCSLKKE